MIKFNKLLEKAKSEKIAMHTPTEEQAITLLKALDKKGYTWYGGDYLYIKQQGEKYIEDICYNLGSDNKVSFGSLDFFQDNDYTIIEFSDIDFKENK